jgi:hypothetical protein
MDETPGSTAPAAAISDGNSGGSAGVDEKSPSRGLFAGLLAAAGALAAGIISWVIRKKRKKT